MTLVWRQQQQELEEEEEAQQRCGTVGRHGGSNDPKGAARDEERVGRTPCMNTCAVAMAFQEPVPRPHLFPQRWALYSWLLGHLLF